jgi:hypothetical protein
MTTDNITHDEGNPPSLEQRLRAKIADAEGFDPYFTIHPDGDMTDAECALVPPLEELLDTPKRLATAVLFLIRHIDDDVTLSASPIAQILFKK